MKKMDLSKMTREEVKAYMEEAMKTWPYDTSIPMTDEQLAAEGAKDVTNDPNGLAILLGLRRK